MKSSQIEENTIKLIENFSEDEFIYDLLLAYGTPKASITRLKKGTYNLSKNKGEILFKKKLFFKEVSDENQLHSVIEQIKEDQATIKHNPRFLIVTDYKTLLAYDIKTNESLDIKLKELAKHYDFFLPWAGIEKYQVKAENLADIKAAEKMAKLYDIIRQDNLEKYNSKESLHELNVFLCRLLFCYFAEDTEIFAKDHFSKSIASHTLEDGSDLDEYLNRLFEVLNTPTYNNNLSYAGKTLLEPLNESKRAKYPKYLQEFPYVNGGLFADKIETPKFSSKSRRILIECGSELNWSEINPDIFGSMIQAVVHRDQRGSMGMHYTSVTNIMKVIEPLFLNELYEELEKNSDDSKKLKKLLERIYKLRIFDPACGSGNFLIIAYKELRKLEMKIFERLQEIEQQKTLSLSKLQLNQFYGIELDDFAHEITMLSLWLAEHQMNLAFKEKFGETNPTLPLKQIGKIVCGNATRLNWEEICPKESQSSKEAKNQKVPSSGDLGVPEIYILGNPPYLGYSLQSKEQKSDLGRVCKSFKNYKNLDYIACWFIKASEYIQGINASFAFVSTNSICQGEQVALLWPSILSRKLEIGFAHQSFKWTNNAKNNAGVTVAIIGIRNESKKPKYLFSNEAQKVAENINCYLSNASSVIVEKRTAPLSILQIILKGSMPIDNGHFLLRKEEKNNLMTNYPESKAYIKSIMGSAEFINGIERYCLWLTNCNVQSLPSLILSRVNKVRDYRFQSRRDATKKLANIAHKFGECRFKEAPSIIIPETSSERREYIPIGFLDKDTVILNSAYAIYDPEPWVFAVVSSKMHMIWVRAVGGRLETRLRYSSSLCYNTFPFPEITEKQKKSLAEHVFNIITERERFPEKTMAELYDPDKMPSGLKEAHSLMDRAIELCYRSKPFTSDEERLEYLFKLYEEMIAKETRSE